MNPLLSDLAALSADRPLPGTVDFWANTFYGHAAVLKRYAGLPPALALKAAVEHGPYILGDHWDQDINAPFPALLVFSPDRYRTLAGLTRKLVFGLGPLIHYAAPLLGPEALDLEKRRLGRTLLVFPPKSTHHITAEYALSVFFREIEARSAGFDTVLACLYWRDIQLGREQPFRERGWPCVSAGHIYDPEFLPRLRAIIELSDAALTMDYGTHIGYCLHLGRPVHIPAMLDVIREAPAGHEGDLTDAGRLARHKAQVAALLAEPQASVRPETLSALNDCFGFSETRSPAAARSLFLLLEEIAAALPAEACARPPDLVELAGWFMERGRHVEAEIVLDQAVRAGNTDPGVGRGLRACRTRLGRESGPEGAVLALGRTVPPGGNRVTLAKNSALSGTTAWNTNLGLPFDTGRFAAAVLGDDDLGAPAGQWLARECRRVLVEGGRLHLVFPELAPLAPVLAELLGNALALPAVPDGVRRRASSLAAALGSAGAPERILAARAVLASAGFDEFRLDEAEPLPDLAAALEALPGPRVTARPV